MTDWFLWGWGITLVLELFFLRTLKLGLFVVQSWISFSAKIMRINTEHKSLLYIGLSVYSNLEMVTRLIKKSCFATIGYIRVRVGSKKPSLVNTICHYSADRRDGFILTTLPHIIHSWAYNTTIIIQVASLTLEKFR